MHLLKHFRELTVRSKNAQELKGLILQLAVQGKLTGKWREENPNVETATVLLKRVKEEKTKLTKEKKVRKGKTSSKVTNEEKYLQIPKKWEWSRLIEIGNLFNGNSVNKAVKEIKYEGLEEGFSYLGTKDINYGFEKLNYDNGVKIPFYEPKFKIAHKKTPLICSEGGSAGKKCGITNQDICFGNKLYALEQYGDIEPIFILSLYQTPIFYKEFQSRMTGIIGGISINSFGEIPIPIPPLEEQKAIVEIVETLFKEVEQLEQLTVERITLKERFVVSALKQIATNNSKKEWAYLQEHFYSFFNETSNIKKLRETVLQLAVQGKFTAGWRANNPNIEDANQLLKRIEKEKAQLIKDKKIKKEKPLPPITKDEIPYELPAGWVWSRFGDSSINMDGFRIPLSKADRAKRQGDYDYYGAQGVIDHIDDFIFNKSLLLIAEDGGNLLRRTKPVAYMAHGKYWVNNHAHVVDTVDEYTKLYLEIFINSIDLSPHLNGQPPMQIKLNRGKLNLISTSFPPLQEQKAIVHKVNALMGLCDALEQQVKRSQKQSEQLMQSVLREVFEGKKELEAFY
jgi:type I restriction enzyme S subunit